MKTIIQYINERLKLNSESKIKTHTILDVKKEGEFDYKGVTITYYEKYLKNIKGEKERIINNIDSIFLALGKIIEKFKNEFNNENVEIIFYDGPTEPGCQFSLLHKDTERPIGIIGVSPPHDNKDKILSGEYLFYSSYDDSLLNKKLEQYIQRFSHPFNEDIHERLNLNPSSTIKTNYCKNPQLSKKIYDGLIDELAAGCNIKDFDDHTKLKEFINNWINQYDITFKNMNIVSRSISMNTTDGQIAKKSYEQRIKYDEDFKIKKPTYQIWFFTTDTSIGFRWFDNKKNYFTEVWDEEDW